jgi:adenylate cyclase
MTRLRDLVRRERKPSIRLPGWLERVISLGIVTEDAALARRQRITNVGAYATAGNAASHFVINSFYDFDGLLIVDVYNAVMTIAALMVPLLHRFGPNVGACVLATLVIGGNTFVVWLLGSESGLQIYFTLAGASLFLFGVEHLKLFLGFFLAGLLAVLFVINYVPPDGHVMIGDSILRGMLSSQAIINTTVINALLVFYALSALHRAETELEHQFQRSEALLSTMMPTSIADRLKSGAEQRIADRIENLSVLFADLVGFTKAAH